VPGWLDILKIDKTSTDLIVFHVSIWGAWSFVWRAKSIKATPSGDWTEQTGQKRNKLQIILFFPKSFYE